MSATTLIYQDTVRFGSALGTITDRSGLQGTASNEMTFLDSGGLTTSQVALKNVATPSEANDGVNKSYVDSLVVSGVTWKNSARLATDGNELGRFSYNNDDVLTLTTTLTTAIDGLEPANGDRILFKNTSLVTEGGTAADSPGIYVVSNYSLNTSMTLTRTSDAANGDSANGAAVFVYDGDVVGDSPNNNDTSWVVTNDAAINWGGAVTWTQMSAAPALGPLAVNQMFVGDTDGDAKDGGANLTYDYSTRATDPVFGVGVDPAANNATAIFNLGTESALTAVAATMNMGDGTGASTINMEGSGAGTVNMLGTGENAIASSGNFTLSTTGASTLDLTGGSGAITIDGTSSAINVGTATTGAISVGSSAAGALSVNNGGVMTVGADSTSMTIGSVANSTSTTMTGQDVNVGSATTTTTDVDGISIDVGSSVTTSLDLLATGTDGSINITAGVGTTIGGSITSTAGAGSTGGGNNIMSGGAGVSNGTGGGAALVGGAGDGTGDGGVVQLQAGGGGTGDGTGGNLVLQSGTGGGSGDSGHIYITAPPSSGTNGTIVLTSGSVDYTKAAGVMTSDGLMTLGSTSADLTLQTTTSGNVVIDSADVTPGASDLTGTNLNVTGQTVTAAAAEDYAFTTFGGTVAGTTTGLVTSVLFEAPTGGTVTDRYHYGMSGSTSGVLGFSVPDAVADYEIIWPAVAPTTGQVLVIDGVDPKQLNWTTPGGASMLALPDQQLYVGDAGGTAEIGTANLLYDRDVATTSLTLGGIATAVTTMTLGTSTFGATIAGGGTGDVSLTSGGNLVFTDNSVSFTKSGGVMTSGGIMTLQSTAADLTLQAATSGNLVFTDNSVSFTKSGGVMTSDGLMTLTTASGNVTVSTTADAGTLDLSSGTATTATSAGGEVDITAGDGNTTGKGGAIDINAGAGGATGAGGDITIDAGAGGETSGNGGGITLTTGSATDGNGGDYTLLTSSAAGDGNAGGSMYVLTGSGSTGESGVGGTGGVGGVVGYVAGAGGVGGSHTTGPGGVGGEGGAFSLTSGQGGAGGAVTSGTGGAGGVGGSASLIGNTGGNGGNSDSGTGGVGGDGGDTLLQAGAGGAAGTGGSPSAGADGNIVLRFANSTAIGTQGSETANIIDIRDSSDNNSLAHVESDGRFYAPAFQTSSDATLKTDINRLNDPMAKLRSLEGYSYHWNEDFSGYSEELEYGVLAQQVESAGLGHLVRGGQRPGDKTVNYQGFIPLLIEALKESDSQVQNLTLVYGQMLKDMKEEIDFLKNERREARMSRRGL